MKRECGFSFPVSVVSLSIAFVYFSTVFIFIDRWFGLFSSPGIMNSLAFTAVAIMCIFNYAVSVFTDPGRVPRTFVPDIEDAVTPIHEIKRKGGDLRYCQKCSHYKPPRAHHCRVCKRCVLRMDHHCIWINNCVGHANYKAFFIFVVCAVIASIYSLVLLVGSLTNDPEEDEPQSRDGDYSRTAYQKEKFIALFSIIKQEGYNLQKVICGLLLVPLSIALTILLGWHIYLVLQNKTTIEYREGVRAMWVAEKGGEVYQHPYDLGAYTNLTTVLGPSILSWVCPMSGHIGSGLRFRTAFDNPAAALRSN